MAAETRLRHRQGVITMKWFVGSLVLLVAVASSLVLAAPAAPRAQVIVFSNSSPHVTVIDGQTNQVTKTTDVPQFTSWTWIDDNNYYDGKNLWVGMQNPNTNDVEVVLFDLDTLQVTRRIPLGKDSVTLYIGKASRTGRVLVAKHASGQLVAIDANTHAVVRTVDLPVTGGVACDVDVITGFDRKERAFVPTMAGNTVLSIDTTSFQVVQTLRFDATRPFMLTASADGRRLWVQEQAGNSNAVVNVMNLQVIERVAAGPVPIQGTYSPDGKLHFTGHNSEFVIANDTETFREVWRARVGANAQKLGVHPAGTFVYAIVTRGASVGVIDAATGRVMTHVALGTNPAGIYIRRL